MDKTFHQHIAARFLSSIPAALADVANAFRASELKRDEIYQAHSEGHSRQLWEEIRALADQTPSEANITALREAGDLQSFLAKRGAIAREFYGQLEALKKSEPYRATVAELAELQAAAVGAETAEIEQKITAAAAQHGLVLGPLPELELIRAQAHRERAHHLDRWVHGLELFEQAYGFKFADLSEIPDEIREGLAEEDEHELLAVSTK